MAAEMPFTWVLTTETLKLALERAENGESAPDIMLDLWEARDPSLTRVQFLQGDQNAAAS